MIKKNHLLPCILSVTVTFLLLIITFIPANAQFKKDSSKKLSISRLNKNEATTVKIKEANVIYPGLLSGNEDQSLDYVEKFSTSRRDYLIRTYNKGKNFFPKAAVILNRHNLPHEFKILLALESAFNGNAVSKAGAVGYWQIMDEVAKEYGLKYVSQFRTAEKNKKSKSFAKNEKKKAKKVITRDDRKNFNKSTYAAARYLQDRCRNLNNDYLLVVASYNCGVGNVWTAMKKTGKINPDFWDIKKYLPAETRTYVMNFIALNVVFNNYEKFTRNTLSFKPIVIKADNFDEKISEEVGEPTSLNNN